ncbi:MAG: flavin reductase family protein [Clostridia bacterium]|nr:flavin reductase family protein [Clostridia bacterium]
MSKRKMNGATLLSPVPPTMVSCRGKDGKANIITIAWTGITCSHPPKTYISIRPERYSYGIIKETGEFVINLTNEKLVKAADLCGMLTGKKVDKFKKCELTEEETEGFSAPMIKEAPMSLCCKVTDIIPLGSHDMFMADIVNVYANEELFDEKDRLSIDTVGLVSYTHGEYFAQGKKLGKFGLSVANKEHKKKK